MTRQAVAGATSEPRRGTVRIKGMMADLVRGWHSRRASVSVMAAVAFPALIGMAGLVVEYGDALMLKEKAQRMADIAAISGATAYTATASTSALNDAVARIATLNGFATANVTGALVASPSGDGNQAVQATVTSDLALGLSSLLGSGNTLSTSATSYVELKSTGTGCIIALSASGTGISLSGSTTLTASNCAVSSNANVTNTAGIRLTSSSTTITAPVVTYNSTTALDSTTLSYIRAPTGVTLSLTKKAIPDPLAHLPAINSLTLRMATVAAMTSPTAPTVSTGTDISFAYNQTATQTAATAAGCTATWASSTTTWTLTCGGSGPFNFGTITLGGGLSVNFNTTSSASTTYNFSGPITNSSSRLSFGPGTYNIPKGIATSGSTTVSFGAGTNNIGAPAACTSGSYSIDNQASTTTFAGPSTFVQSCGLSNGSGRTLSLGTG
jgi:Flp pilus assembly protein TadG